MRASTADQPAMHERLKSHWMMVVFGLLVILLTLVPAAGRPSPAMSQSDQPAQVWIEGRVKPRLTVELAVGVPGRIEAVLVREGEVVESGQVVLRLDGYERYAEELDAARLQVLLAEQALDELRRTEQLSRAEAELVVSQARKAQALAEDHLASLQRPKNPLHIAQAHANFLLTEHSLADSREDLRKARQRYENKNHIMWRFVNHHQFKLQLAVFESRLAYYERRYWDALEKYEDLLAPVDAIELAQAQAELALANAHLEEAERERQERLAGPDLQALQATSARLDAARARLAAAQQAVAVMELRAPFTGEVIDLPAKAGQWASIGQRLLVIADFSEWVVETLDLGEIDVTGLKTGQIFTMTLDAFPGGTVHGMLESIGLYATEQDGDVYYTAIIAVEPTNLPLRWGMTVRIEGPH